jgi:capsular exopolysaccharide synthesis family protein
VDLIGYLRLLRRRWWIISLAILVSVGAAVFATSTQHKRYQSSTRLLVSGSSSLSSVDEITRRQLAQQRAVLFSQIATTSPVIAAAEQAAAKAGVAPQVESSGAGISAAASGTDPFLTITVTANSPQAAQAIANQFVNVLPPELARLDQVPSAVTALLTVVNSAGLPTTPSSPNPKRNILIGLALGIILGIAAALIRETLDTTLRDSEEVRRLTRATILGIVPREFDDERLPAATRPHSRRSEAYRQVRTNLEFADADEQAPHSFVVTSAGQGEGKSTTVANLALLISRAGKSVAVIDADLRKPTLAALFNATGDFGLSDVLAGSRSLRSVLQPIAGEQITVVASGPTVTRPSELLSSPAMEQILQELARQFDVVIIDSPPVLAITDALLVGKHTDGMVVVTRMRRTTRSGLRRSLEAIERVHAHLLGVVVNAATEAEDKRYGYTKGYTKGYLSDEVSPTEYLSSARSSEPLPKAASRVVVKKAPPPRAGAPYPPYVPPPAEPAPPPVYLPEPVAEDEPEPPPVYLPEPVAEDEPEPPPVYLPEPVAEDEPAPPPVYLPEPVVENVGIEEDFLDDDLASAYEPEPRRYLPQQRPAHSSQQPPYATPAQQWNQPEPAYQPAPPPFPPPPPSQTPPSYQPPPPPSPPRYEQRHAAAREPVEQASDSLEQPEPTFRPPKGSGSSGAVYPGERVSRSAERRRRGRGGKRHAEDEVGQRGDAG